VAFVVPGQAVARGEPGEGALDCPPARDHREALLAGGFAHDVQRGGPCTGTSTSGNRPRSPRRSPSSAPSYGLPGREVRRQLPPGTPRADHVEDRVHDRPPRMLLRAATSLHRRQQRLDQRPLLIVGVRRVPRWSTCHPATGDQSGAEITQTRRPFFLKHGLTPGAASSAAALSMNSVKSFHEKEGVLPPSDSRSGHQQQRRRHPGRTRTTPRSQRRSTRRSAGTIPGSKG